jgi:CRISPR-associated endoribonuclease Cas6
MAQHAQTTSRVRRIELTVRPEERFPVPQSDGYPVYGSLLDVLDDIDEQASAKVHDSPLGSLHSSGLQGVFGGSDRAHHKTVLPDKEYALTLGIVDPDDEAIFEALVSALVLEDEPLELTDGEFRVERFESANTTHEQLLERTAGVDDPTIGVAFRTPTCIEEAGDVTTMFPYRGAVFPSLLGKWNRSCPEDLELDLAREDVLRHVIEKPDARAYKTHSVLVNRVQNDDGESRNLFRQGFTGECAYAFKDASESVENAVTVLALFGAFSGVGSAVSRGCGTVEVELR